MSGCHLPIQKNENNNCICVYCLDERLVKAEDELSYRNCMALENEREKIIKEIFEKHKDEIYKQVLNKFVYGITQTPHKCPVCEGTGKDKNRLVAEPYEESIKILVAAPCRSCDGKGILWG